jgi:hypothetical protein
MSTNVEAMRKHLMDTLADLRNRETPMEVDRARAIAQVASALIDSARVEVEFLKVTGVDANPQTGFFAPRLPGGSWDPQQTGVTPPTTPTTVKQLPKGVLGVTKHVAR